MYGWINDAIEKMIISKYGEKLWETIRELAQCDTETNHWVINREYPDFLSDNLITSACKVLGDRIADRDNFLVDLGEFFLNYVRLKGYDNLMRCQGSTLMEWLSNINKVHSHLHHTLGKDFSFPEFYCTDVEGHNVTDDDSVAKRSQVSSMNLYYRSRKRGTMMNGFVLGMVKEAARAYFKLSISATCLAIQGVGGSEFTAWRLDVSPMEVSSAEATKSTFRDSKIEYLYDVRGDVAKRQSGESARCPFSGRAFVPLSNTMENKPKSSDSDETAVEVKSAKDLLRNERSVEAKLELSRSPSIGCPHQNPRRVVGTSSGKFCEQMQAEYRREALRDGGLTGAQLKEIFPFHIVVNGDFKITHMGNKVASYIPGIVVGSRIDSWLKLSVPTTCQWNWEDIIRCKHSTFELAVIDHKGDADGGFQGSKARLSGGLYLTKSSTQTYSNEHLKEHDKESDLEEYDDGAGEEMAAFFLLQPDVRTLHEMVTNKLTWSDFPKHTSQPNLILLAEHLKSETYYSMKSRTEANNAKNILEMKRIFVRFISHEIRTPLNTACMGLNLVRGFLQEDGNVKDHNRAAELDELTEEITESCEIAVSILNDLLLYEKLEGDVVVLNRRCEPALQVIEESLHMFSIQAKQASLRLEFTFEKGERFFRVDELENPSILIDVDKMKIGQVIRNLVGNAIKFSKINNGSRVEVHATLREYDMSRKGSSTEAYVRRSSSKSWKDIQERSEHQRYLRIEVIDTGPGISVEDQAILFENIVQFDPTKLQSGNGTGLGLFICKGIMDLHGGTVGVHSEGKGKGATFFIELPAHHQDQPCAHETVVKNPKPMSHPKAPPRSRAHASTGYHPDPIKAFNEWRVPDSPKQSINVPQTTAIISLPNLQSELVTTPSNVTYRPEPVAAASGGECQGKNVEITENHRFHILVVDDSAATRKMIVRYLKLHKLCDEPVEANNGLKAVAIIGQSLNAIMEIQDVSDKNVRNNFDCILMDFVMPEMDGPTATKKIREAGYRGLIVGVTGNVLPEDRAYFVHCGADAVMAKPMDMSKMKELLEKELTRRVRFQHVSNVDNNLSPISTVSSRTFSGFSSSCGSFAAMNIPTGQDCSIESCAMLTCERKGSFPAVIKSTTRNHSKANDAASKLLSPLMSHITTIGRIMKPSSSNSPFYSQSRSAKEEKKSMGAEVVLSCNDDEVELGAEGDGGCVGGEGVTMEWLMAEVKKVGVLDGGTSKESVETTWENSFVSRKLMSSIQAGGQPRVHSATKIGNSKKVCPIDPTVHLTECQLNGGTSSSFTSTTSPIGSVLLKECHDNQSQIVYSRLGTGGTHLADATHVAAQNCPLVLSALEQAKNVSPSPSLPQSAVIMLAESPNNAPQVHIAREAAPTAGDANHNDRNPLVDVCEQQVPSSREKRSGSLWQLVRAVVRLPGRGRNAVRPSGS